MACERPWMARRSGPGWPGGCCARSSFACCLRGGPRAPRESRRPRCQGAESTRATGRPGRARTGAPGDPRPPGDRWYDRVRAAHGDAPQVAITPRAASPPLPRGTSSDDPPTGALSLSEQRVDATRSGRLALGVVPRVPGRPCRARAAPRQDRDGTRHRARCASLDRGEMCDADAHPRTGRCYALARELFAMRGLRVRAETQA
jgi:hypothetical protein